MVWTEDDILLLSEGYSRGQGVKEIALILGRSAASIRNQAYKLGITTRDDAFTELEVAEILSAYEGDKKRGELNLAALSIRLKRTPSAICAKARALGLTNISRKRVCKPPVDKRKYKTEEERSAARTANLKRRHAQTPHPMQGKRHSHEVCELISEKSKASWASNTKEERALRVNSMLKGRLKKSGTLTFPRPGASWKAGWREVSGRRNYYRSRWEANYARYLDWLRERGEIKDWAHEPETFWFDGIKRGVRSYLPDFRVWENDGSTRLHEVKGWMDARSKTTLKRMSKYHPDETIIVIREKQYNEIARKLSSLIEGWESGERKDRY